MAVVDIQRRGQQIGRLRMGEKVGTGKFDKDGNEKMRPVRRDTWRLTTGSRFEAEAIAARFGGQVRPWEGEYEVATDTDEIPVTVPPRDEVVSQWYEMWSKGGCQRRCTGLRQKDDSPCLCPHAKDPDDADLMEKAALRRAEMAAMNPPQACKLITRVNLMIPDLPGLGVFRLDTSSYYAAVEIGDTARIMQMARDRGVFLPAVARIDQRQRVANGQTKKFPVPVLEILATFRDLASGAIEQAGITAQLPPVPGAERLAITTGTPSAVPAVAAPPASAAHPAVPRQEPPLTAQQIADQAKTTITKAGIKELMKLAAVNRCGTDLVEVDDAWEELDGYLNDLLRVLAASEDGS